MISIDLREPDTPEWKRWRDRCDKAQKKLNDSYEKGEPGKVRPELYSEMKTFYFSRTGPFRGKCAYCESVVQKTHPGDLDHYRPKGRVRINLDGHFAEVIAPDGTRANHPGYYWLAYAWDNLLPACEFCNRIFDDDTPAQPFGKWDRFPLKDEDKRISKPGSHGEESPLLLNPTDRSTDISAHIDFSPDGSIFWLSVEGEMSVRILGLDRENLCIARFDAYNAAYDDFFTYLAAKRHKSPDAERRRRGIMDIREGVAEYSAVKRVALKDAWAVTKSCNPDEISSES